MPEQPPQPEPEEQEGGGAPSWMLTYGDSVTLLLTFFVMLLTFSTPNEEDFRALAKGMMAGSRQMSLFRTRPGADNLTPEERRLQEGRLGTEGAEKPPMEEQQPLKELTKYHEEIEISQLRKLKGALVIRVPLRKLFGQGDELLPTGMSILGRVVQMTRVREYSIVVNARAARDVAPEQREQTALAHCVTIVRYLGEKAAETCGEVGISNNIQLVDSPLERGICEIVMLET